MYGDEELGIPPEELYDRVDAEEAIQHAHKVLQLVLRLFEEARGSLDKPRKAKNN